MQSADTGTRAAEDAPASARVSDPPLEPAQIHTVPVTDALSRGDEHAADVTTQREFAQRRRQLSVDAAFLADGFASLEALREFQDELEAAYTEALSDRQPAPVWGRLLVEHRLVHALAEYLEARA